MSCTVIPVCSALSAPSRYICCLSPVVDSTTWCHWLSATLAADCIGECARDRNDWSALRCLPQAQICISAPSSVARPVPTESRQRPAPSLMIWPSACTSHFWLVWPLHGQVMTSTPLATPASSASMHLTTPPVVTRNSRAAVHVHCWFAVPAQLASAIRTPFAEELPGTVRHCPCPEAIRLPIAVPSAGVLGKPPTSLPSDPM